MVLEKGVPDLRDKILLIFDPDADVVAMRIILTSINAIKKYFIQFLMKVIYLTNILETLLFLTLFMLFLFSFFTSV